MVRVSLKEDLASTKLSRKCRKIQRCKYEGRGTSELKASIRYFAGKWEFPITLDLIKSYKLAYQTKKVDEEKKKAVIDTNKKGLKRTLKMDEIQGVKKCKINLEETIKNLC